jgi:hypothetical protein
MSINTVANIGFAFDLFVVLYILAAAVLDLAGYKRPFGVTWTPTLARFVAGMLLAIVLYAWVAESVLR